MCQAGPISAESANLRLEDTSTLKRVVIELQRSLEFDDTVTALIRVQATPSVHFRTSRVFGPLLVTKHGRYLEVIPSSTDEPSMPDQYSFHSRYELGCQEATLSSSLSW